MMYNELSLDEYILFTEHSLNRIFLNLDKLFMESELLEKEYELKLLTENPDIDRLNNFYFENTDMKKKSDEISMKKDGLFGSIWKLIKVLIAKVKNFLFGIKEENLPEKVETDVTVDRLEKHSNFLFQALEYIKTGSLDKAEKLLETAKKHPIIVGSIITIIGRKKVRKEWEDAKAYINKMENRLTAYEQFKIDDNDEKKEGLFNKIIKGIKEDIAKAKDVIHYKSKVGAKGKLTAKNATDVANEQKKVRAKIEKLPELNEYINKLKKEIEEIPKKIPNKDLQNKFETYRKLEDKDSSGKLKKGLLLPFINDKKKISELRALDTNGDMLKAYTQIRKLREKLKEKETERDAIYSAAKSHNISIENYFKKSTKDTVNKAMSDDDSKN